MDGVRVADGVLVTIRRITSGFRSVGSAIRPATKWFIAYPASGYQSSTPTYSNAGFSPWLAVNGTLRQVHVVDPSGRPGLSVQFDPYSGYANNTAFRLPVATFHPTAGLIVGHHWTTPTLRLRTDVMALTSEGAVRWACRQVKSTSSSADQTMMVASSPSAVYVASQTELTKLDPATGETVWSISGVAGVNSTDYMAVDGSDNIYLGYTNVIHKVDSSGVRQWTRTIASAAAIRQIAVNKSTGDVAVVYNSTATYSWTVALINTSGTLQWVRALGGTTTTSTGVAFDAAGSVYSTAALTDALYVAKWDSSGTLQFQRSITISKSGGSVTGAAASRLWSDARDGLWVHGLVTHLAANQALVYRLPATVPTGAYVCNDFTSTIAASALATATPAHTLTTTTPTFSTGTGFTTTMTDPVFIYTGPYNPPSKIASVAMADTFKATVQT